MGLLADIFDFLSSFDEGSYIEDAKAWGDKVWNYSSNKKSGTLSLYLVNAQNSMYICQYRPPEQSPVVGNAGGIL